VRVSGDADLLAELAELFRDDSIRLVDRIRQPVMRKDSEELDKAAHGLKGSVLNFGAKTLADVAQAVNGQAKGDRGRPSKRDPSG